MTVQELIETLEEFDGGQEVRIAHQPSWPFEYSISQVVCPNPRDLYEVLKDDEGWSLFHVGGGQHVEDTPYFDDSDPADAYLDSLCTEQGVQAIVYIAEGTQIGYLPSPASRALSWR